LAIFYQTLLKGIAGFFGGYFLNFWIVIKNRAWFEKLQVEKRKKLFRVFFGVYALMMMGLFSISLT
jgi:hypothetical protein